MQFLTAVTSEQALATILSFPAPDSGETVDLEDALGRVLAEDLEAAEEIPPFDRSLVDGFAVKVRDVQGAKETSPGFLQIVGSIGVGEASTIVLGDGQAVQVSTGAMIPGGADGVVMEEYVRRLPDSLEVIRTAHRGENICFKGEDIRRGETPLKIGKRLTPFDSGLLSALGVRSVPVYPVPRVAVISSGDEIVPVEQTPPLGKVRDINRYTVSGLVSRYGGNPHFLGIARDDKDEIRDKLSGAGDFDLILISGGSSKGERDFVVDAIESLGGTISFHGINIKPGKPTIFGTLFGKPVFGLPGHPSSCIAVMVRFVLPLLRRLSGERSGGPMPFKGRLTTNIPSSYGIEEYARVATEMKAGELQVTPIFSKSSVISALSRADGYVVIPEGVDGMEAGEEVEVYLY